MYLYVYDSFLSQPKYEHLLAAVERRVTDLGIQGKIARLSALKNVRELVQDAIKGGVKTVVAIGDDQTFTKMINVAAAFDVTLGLIPVDGNSRFARVLGIPPKELACDVVAGRIIRKLDLGKINNYFFLNAAEISTGQVTLSADEFSISPTTNNMNIRLCNIGIDVQHGASNPADGILEAIITPIRNGIFSKRQLAPTVLPFTRISVQSNSTEDVAIIMDDLAMVKTPATIEVAAEKLRVIVGGRRQFD